MRFFRRCSCLGTEIWQAVCGRLQSWHDKSLFDAVSQRSVAVAGTLTSQSLSSLLWAFSATTSSDEVVFQTLADHALTKLSEFTPQELSNTLWAFASAYIANSSLAQEVAGELLHNLSRLKVQEM